MISNKWIYKCTYNSNGILAWYKACFVAWGFNQIVGINYEKKWSLVIQFIILCVLIRLVAINNYHIHQMDVTIVFLYGNLKEVIYIEEPPRFIQPKHEHKVCHLF